MADVPDSKSGGGWLKGSRKISDLQRILAITAYRKSGNTVELVQFIANHDSPKMTDLRDRTSDQIDLDEIERIRS